MAAQHTGTPENPVPPRAEDLNDEELAWLAHVREGLPVFADAAGAAVENGPRGALDACDAIVRWWHTLPGDDRPDANTLVMIVGIALGDALAAELGLEWKIVTDAFGTDLGLWRGAPKQIILSPTHSVAKRFQGSADGFVADLFDQICAGVREIDGRG